MPVLVLGLIAAALYWIQRAAHEWSIAGELEAMVKAGLTPAQMDEHLGDNTVTHFGDSISIASVALLGFGFLVFLASRSARSVGSAVTPAPRRSRGRS